MSAFKKKKSNKKDEKIDKDLTMRDNKEYVKDQVRIEKVDMYSVPGVDEVEYHKPDMRIKKSLLNRPTSYYCPKCQMQLYNTKLDGLHFFCPSCERQYHIKEIKNK